jgi:hypothetical protein
MSFEESVRQKCLPLPWARIKIVDFPRFDLSAVQRGVLFVLAEWSSPSVTMFRSLCRLAAEAPTVIFPILVLNADEFETEDFRAMFGLTPYGWGESFWIKDGQVVYGHMGSKEIDAMRVMEEKIVELGQG